MFLDDGVEEFERISGLVHLVEGVDDHLSCDVAVEQVCEVDGFGPFGATCTKALATQVIERCAGPGEAVDHVLFV